jgi:hypothetical protein
LAGQAHLQRGASSPVLEQRQQPVQSGLVDVLRLIDHEQDPARLSARLQ